MPFKYPKHSYLKYLAFFFSKREIGSFAYWKQPHLQDLTRLKSKKQRKRKQRKVLLWRPRKQMFIRAQTHRFLSQWTYLNMLSLDHSQIKFWRLKGYALKNIMYCWNMNINFVTKKGVEQNTSSHDCDFVLYFC